MAAEVLDSFSDDSNDEFLDEDWQYDENDNTFASSSNYDGKSANNMEISKMPQGCSSDQSAPCGTQVSRMNLNTAKAGMDGLDKAKINQIIHEASKGSRFYQNEKKKEKQVEKRIEELQRKMAAFTEEQRNKGRQNADKIIEELEDGRDLSRVIVHVDMDAFYAAVEMRDDPSLRSKPMAVGGNDMLCTSNYLARRFGVRAGMPGFIGKKLCPSLTIVPTNFDKYTKVSHEIREVLAEYDPNFLPMSLDEAYLDITEYVHCRRSDSRRNRISESSCELGGRKIYCDINEKGRKREMEEKKDFKIMKNRCDTNGGKDAEVISQSMKDREGFDLACDRKNRHVSEYGEDDVVLYGGTRALGVKAVTSCTMMESRQLQADQGLEGDKNLGMFCTNEVELQRFYCMIEEVVNEMRLKIEKMTQLTASAGIAPNMFLAKVCSDQNKPNGQFFLKPEREHVMKFISQLPLRKAYGIGRVSEQILTSVLKVSTCFELYERRDLMELLFTPTACRSYLEISLGLGSNVVEVDRERKSMSTETTFREISKPDELLAKCHELCEELSESLNARGLTARKVGIKLKTIDFEVKTRVTTTAFPVQGAKELYSHARKLILNEIRTCSPKPLRLRLMGVRAAEFCEKGTTTDSKQLTITSLIKKTERLGECNLITPSSSTKTVTDMAAREERVAERNMKVIERDLKPGNSEKSKSECSTMVECSNAVKLSSNEEVTASLPSSFTCPVCDKDLTFKFGDTLLQMNQHVDVCLRKQASPGVLKHDSGNETGRGKQTTKKRKREPSQTRNKSNKRNPMDRFLAK